MTFHALFLSIAVLLVYRIFRSTKFRDRLLLAALGFFLALTFAMHPWLENSSRGLLLLEKIALASSLLWLALNPLLAWREKQGERRKACFLLRNGRGPLSEMVRACLTLASEKRGALIAIERRAPLEDWIHTGVPLEAKIGREIIHSIFASSGSLHDGGMVIRGERIAACGVVFPLSKRLDLPTEFGTRHRAALGLSEVTDSLVLVISEETGKISLADQGMLLYDVPLEQLKEMLEKGLKGKLVRPASSRKQSQAQRLNLRAQLAPLRGKQISASV